LSLFLCKFNIKGGLGLVELFRRLWVDEENLVDITS